MILDTKNSAPRRLPVWAAAWIGPALAPALVIAAFAAASAEGLPAGAHAAGGGSIGSGDWVIGETAMALPAMPGDKDLIIGRSALDQPTAAPAWNQLRPEIYPHGVDALVRKLKAADPLAPTCFDRPPCKKVPSAPKVIEKRAEIFGPIENSGWASYAHVGNERIYAFPDTVRSKARPAGQSWTWGLGAQFDALPFAGLGESSHDLFAFGEVGTGYDSLPTSIGNNYQARLTVGFGF